MRYWTSESPNDPYRFERIGEVPKVIVAAWSAFEAFRKLGFPSEAISTISAPGIVLGTATPYDLIHVELAAEGKRFVVTIGRATGDGDVEAHGRLMSGIREGRVSERELERAWLWSPLVNPVERFIHLGMVLANRGFVVAVNTAKVGQA